MIRALTFLILLAGLVRPLHADDSAQPERIPRIGYLATHATWTRYFHSAMKDLGYLEGKNLIVVWRLSDEKPEHLTSAAQEFVALGMDLIFVDSTPGALAAKGATNRIPIVIAGLVDPVGTGLVASLPKPGGNVTGTTIITRDVTAKRVELLKEAVPTATAIAILWNPTHPHGPVQVKDAEAAATRAGLKVHQVPVRRAQDIDAAFASLAKRPYGLLVTDDTLLINQADRLASLAIERRLPAISGFRTFAEGGGLMSYGPSLAEQFQGAAQYVDKIIKGAQPSELPVRQPTKFDLLVNLRTARALKLNIPQSILVRADEVIR
jgi:putative tryptophan/tyrosine transport system substrate-binding protein